MSLYKPKKSRFWHFDFQYKGQRYNGSTGCTAKRDAQRVEDDQRRQVSLGVQAKPTITLEEACNKWQTEVGDNLKSKSNTLYQFGYLIAALGGSTLLHAIEFTDLRTYAAIRRGKVSDSTINREIQLLRRVVNWLRPAKVEVPEIEWDDLMAKEPDWRIRELTFDEERRLFAHLHDNLKPLVRFALLSGQRRSEIISLRWADVDEVGARATVQVKGGSKHSFPLSPAMLAIIKAQPKVCPQVFTYVCQRPAPRRKDRPARVKGERYPFSKQGWMRQWRRALKDAGIEDYRFHDNRHTAATRNLRSSGNIVGVQRLLGHKNVGTTTRYAHAQEDDVRAMLFATESRIIPEPDDEGLPKPQKSAKNGE
ncbi:site-specific integrase [Qipengyuania atrilutea]|uniref:Site-specific integrase n=1 Tax=Qipengyuania atrilutea TaxID=2744473 RepID=A0A850H398_9SPHN|nr:site-specific integrase [Actirhodobacter atriluteus]NVD44353.1 site-specific integrase [Actirhodobacter atriluteus]